MPTEAAFSLVFYLAAVAILRAGGLVWPAWPAAALIVWSGLTLFWGDGDTHRTIGFALGALCTLLFAATMQATLGDRGMRRHVATLLIWAGTLNALWSIGRGLVLHTITPQLLGWGVTHHPVLGASVMAVCLLTTLIRTVTEPHLRWLHAAGCLVMAAFILLTESRGPLLAAALGALIIGLGGAAWRQQAGLVIMSMCALLLREPLSWRQHQMSVLLDRGDHHRFEAWHRTLQLVAERPLFGHGLAANLDLPGITFPHDLYLGVLFYSGLVGFGLFGWLAALVTRRLLAMTPGPDRLWLAALWVSALVSGLTDLGQITKGPGALWFIFWLPAGLILAYPYPTRISPDPWADSQATA